MGTMLITGGAGFIGSNFVRHVLKNSDDAVVVLDKLTYAGCLESLNDVREDARFTFARGDIADETLVARLLHEHDVESIVNFAAESHVDRSIDSPRPFIETNIVGTFVLLDAARRHYEDLKQSFGSDEFLVIAVSGEKLFSEDSLDLQLEALERLESIDGVVNILSPATLYRELFGAEEPQELHEEITSTDFY